MPCPAMPKPETKTVWLKICPACGHTAYEHTEVEPGLGGDLVRSIDPRFRHCKHAVPVKGRADAFTFCGCTVKKEDTERAGNIRLIRADAKAVRAPDQGPT